MRSHSFTAILAAVAVSLLAGSAAAQIRPGDAGFQMIAKSGTTGTLCRGFTCTPYAGNVSRGETATLEVRGKFGLPYVVAFSTGASNCIAIPGFFHSLILDLNIPLVVAGTMSIHDSIRACPGGIGRLQLPIPQGLPPKTMFAMQGIATTYGLSGDVLAFTAAIQVTVQ